MRMTDHERHELSAELDQLRADIDVGREPSRKAARSGRNDQRSCSARSSSRDMR